MSMSLAELDAQDVTLLPERATLHHGGLTVVVITQTNIASNIQLGLGNSGGAGAGQLNLNWL